MSPTCRNCGHEVSKPYLRVFAPEEMEKEGEVRACPNCNKIRDGADTRQIRARATPDVEGDVA